MIIIKNIFRRKTRSVLTISGIAIGIGAVVALVSISNGFQKSWEKLLAQRGTDITVLSANAPNVYFSSIDSSIADDLRNIPGVEDVTKILSDIVSIDDRPTTGIVGLDPNEFSFSHIRLVKGRIFSQDKKEIIIGRILADSLKKDIGDVINIETDVFEVVGVFEAGNIYADGAGIMYINQLQMLMNRPDQVTVIELRVKDNVNLDDIKAQIKKRFPNLSALGTSEVARADQGVRMAQAFSWATSLIALIVGAVGTMNTMIMSVFERTREIGVLRSLGWRKKKILRMIVGESLILGILGGILGIILGAVAEKIIEEVPRFKGIVEGAFTWDLFLQALAIAVILGILGGSYPAIRASKLSPMEALRYE